MVLCVIYSRKTKHYGNKIVSRVTYTVRDLYGWNSNGLKTLANSVGLTLKEKDLLEKYKTKMFEALKEHTLEFLVYTKEDVTSLIDIFYKKLFFLNETARELDIPTIFNEQIIRITTGSNANQMLFAWLNKGSTVDFQLALRKQGIINPRLSLEKLQMVRNLHQELFFSENFVETFHNNPKKYKILLQKTSYDTLAYSSASISS